MMAADRPTGADVLKDSEYWQRRPDGRYAVVGHVRWKEDPASRHAMLFPVSWLYTRDELLPDYADVLPLVDALSDVSRPAGERAVDRKTLYATRRLWELLAADPAPKFFQVDVYGTHYTYYLQTITDLYPGDDVDHVYAACTGLETKVTATGVRYGMEDELSLSWLTMPLTWLEQHYPQAKDRVLVGVALGLTSAELAQHVCQAATHSVVPAPPLLPRLD